MLRKYVHHGHPSECVIHFQNQSSVVQIFSTGAVIGIMRGKIQHYIYWHDCICQFIFRWEVMEMTLLTCQQHPGQHLSCCLLWRQALVPSRDLKQTNRKSLVSFCLRGKHSNRTKSFAQPSSSTLNPADLCGRPVALLVLGSDAEHDGRAVGGRAVDVGVVQLGGADGARHLGAAVDPDEGHLAGALGAGGAALPHRHVHGVLQDAAGRSRWRLPRDVDWIVCLHVVGDKDKQETDERLC